MTREEASKEIEEEFNEFLKGTGLDNEKYLKSAMETNEDLRKVIEANRMAIKALQQQSCEDIVNMKDLEECKELMTDIHGDTAYAVKMSDIRKLPPITPKPKTDILDKIVKEIIDTGAYEQEVNGKTDFLKGISYCLSVIDKYTAGKEN